MSTAISDGSDPKDQFEHIFENSPHAVFIHDLKEITHVNKAFLLLYGYRNSEEVIGKPPLETIIHPDDFELILEVRKMAKKQGSLFIPSVRLLKSDGSIFMGEGHVSLFRYEGRTYHQVHTRDVTEFRKAENALLESEEKYRTLFESSLDGIYKSTPEGRFVDVNPALVKMLGYNSVSELLAIDINTQLYFKPEDRKIMASNIEDQYPLKKKDGSVIWVEDHSYYEYDEQGNIIFHHGILRDVTSKLEKQTELEDLLSVTEDQNKRLQNFAHIISHNIRSHSANLSSLVHYMQEDRTEEEKGKLFDMLKTSTIKLEETIQNLNEIITVDRNLTKPLESRSLKKEVENALKVLSGDIIRNEVKVLVNIPYATKAEVIPAYLDSILLNLLTNAIKYRSPKRNPVIEITAEREGEFSLLHFKDNGVGIDLKRNGKKLFRMYETFNYNKDSRGFGLYITKNQVEAMSGQIKVKSEPDVGSTFTVFLKNV